MKVVKFVPSLMFVCLLASPAFAEYVVGDMVVVIHDTNIKVGEKALQGLARGVGLKVQAVNGEWLWVSNEATGWIKKSDVATPTQAIAVFTEQIRKNPHDSDAHVCRGLAWFDKGEIEIAIADMNEAIRLEPNHPSAYGSRAICWWAKREVDKAIADCSEAIRLEPRDAMHYANRGILWNMKGEYDNAIKDADTAIHLLPDLVTAHIVRGNALLRTGDFSHALAEFNEALRINPRDAAAYGARGRVFASTGQYDRAQSDLDKAVELDPKDKDACNEIARFYATCPVEEYRNGLKAVAFAEKACELSGWHWASAISVLAAAHAETGDFAKAVDWQEKATQMVSGIRRTEYKARLELYKTHKPYREELRNLSSYRPTNKSKIGGG